MDIRRAYVEYHDKAIAVEAHLPTDGTNIQDKMISIVISQSLDFKRIQTKKNERQIKLLEQQ